MFWWNCAFPGSWVLYSWLLGGITPPLGQPPNQHDPPTLGTKWNCSFVFETILCGKDSHLTKHMKNDEMANFWMTRFNSGYSRHLRVRTNLSLPRPALVVLLVDAAQKLSQCFKRPSLLWLSQRYIAIAYNHCLSHATLANMLFHDWSSLQPTLFCQRWTDTISYHANLSRFA